MNRKCISYMLFLLIIACTPSTALTTQETQTKGPGLNQAPSQSPPPTQTFTTTPSPFIYTFPDFPTSQLIEELPIECPGLGHQAYSEPSIAAVFTIQEDEYSIVLDRGRQIVVTSSSDEVNGDTTSLNGLNENPGADGISLREALLVTNHDPGEYTIHFDPSLKGAVIQVGSWDHTELPPLEGGAVVLNGDINGDQEPDITITNEVAELTEYNAIFGFRIHANNNTLYALSITGFTVGVFFDAPSTNQVYSNNALSHLVIDGESGLGLYSGRAGENEPIEVSNNSWKNTWIVDNNLYANSGIGFSLHRASGDSVEDLFIQNNQIFIQSSEEASGRGIDISPGFGSDSKGNQFRRVILRDNTIEGNPEIAIAVNNGFGDSKDNAVEDILIQGNQINISGSGKAIDIAAGHGLRSQGNTINKVRIVDNNIKGSPSVGIDLLSGFDGAGGNAIHQVEISNNVLLLSPQQVLHSFGIDLTAGFWVNEIGNTISDVILTENDIEGALETSFFISSGAVGSSMNRVERVQFSQNQIKLSLPEEPGGPQHGINITTGDGATDYADPDYQPVVYPNGNLINDIWVSGNVVTGFSSGQEVLISTGDPGVRDNAIQNIYILGNELTGVLFESGILDSTISLEHGGEDGNVIQRVYIQQNTMEQANLREHFNGEEIVSGGVVLSAGNGASLNTTRDIWIVANQISSQAPGINLVAGWAQLDFPPSSGNTISGVRMWCNTIAENPKRLEQYFTGIRGINIVGGWGRAQDNRVEDISIERNRIEGVFDDVSVFDYLGEDNQGNSAEIP
jgi:hypothetical protein